MPRLTAEFGRLEPPRRVLLVEDSAAERVRMEVMLTRLQFEVVSAENGAQALDILAADPLELVISDWQMPELDGLEFCRRAREDLGLEGMYFIILTGHAGQENLVRAFEAGADDFLSKPVHVEELRVRLGAGQRICALRSRLSQQLAHAQADLLAASRLQRELLPPQVGVVEGHEVACLFQPAAELGGDMLGYHALGDQRVAFYLLDVCGHGAAAALLSFAVSHHLSQMFKEDPERAARDPHQLVQELNRRFQDDSGNSRFFTIILGCVDARLGTLRYCQAAHPPAQVLGADGSVQTLESSGLPVGIFSDAVYESGECPLADGQRLAIFSDGLSECENPAGEQFGESRLRGFLHSTLSLSPAEAVEALNRACLEWRGGLPMDDDLSLILLQRSAGRTA